MSDVDYDKLKGKELTIKELYKAEPNEVDNLKKQLRHLKEKVISWSKGDKLDIEDVGDALIIFAVFYDNMCGMNYTINSFLRQAFFDVFVDMDKEQAVNNPPARSVNELFSLEVAREHISMSFEELGYSIQDWLDGEPVEFIETFFYLEVFREIFRLLSLVIVSDEVGVF